jgi:hypothetical protein
LIDDDAEIEPAGIVKVTMKDCGPSFGGPTENGDGVN